MATVFAAPHAGWKCRRGSQPLLEFFPRRCVTVVSAAGRRKAECYELPFEVRLFIVIEALDRYHGEHVEDILEIPLSEGKVASSYEVDQRLEQISGYVLGRLSEGGPNDPRSLSWKERPDGRDNREEVREMRELPMNERERDVFVFFEPFKVVVKRKPESRNPSGCGGWQCQGPVPRRCGGCGRR